MHRGDQRQRLDVVDGIIENVKFMSQTGFTVLVAQLDGDVEETSLVGELGGELERGARFTARGRWVVAPKWGRQFRFEALDVHAPTTADQMVARLVTYPGIGKSTAEKIVEQLGERTWEIMDRDVEALRHIPGIGARALEKIKAHHHRQHGPVAQIRTRLIDVGAPPSLAKSLHEEYGGRALDMLADHPYQVAGRIERFGFALAERFARATGLNPETDERVEAGVIHALRQQRLQGHCCVPPTELSDNAMQLLRVRTESIDSAVDRLLDRGALRYEFGRLFLAGVSVVEARVARLIQSLTRPVRAVWDTDVEKADGLSSGQRAALDAVACSGVTVLTGGPGTGKSTAVAAVIEMAERAGVEVTLCAPTGRAARRLSEATGREASTIHRLLRPILGTKDFHHDGSNPLPAGLLVVDEVSMVDLDLADALLGALTLDHRLLLVGDADQLPSVGPGNILADLIDAASQINIALVRLEQVFRQAEGSSIIANAHRMLAGEPLLSDDPRRGSSGQFYMVPARTPEEAQAKIATMATMRIPAAYGFDPQTEVQVLSPVHRGVAGVESFNALLQNRYSYKGQESFWGAGSRRFSVGERVIQVKNDYERNVFNGDIGIVSDFDETFLTVDFDGAPKQYKRFDLANLRLAYAMTIHKSQGGEFPAVLIPVLRNNHRMLTRNLLYTAITRATTLCVIVGHLDAVQQAVQTTAERRWTSLSQRLTT